MFELRRFKNADPPALAEIWKSQPPQRGLMQPVSASILEQCVFSKQYFDPEGLIVATHEGQPVGFVHASFGPDEEGTHLETDSGTTHMLLLRGDLQEPSLADDLLAASEEYLRSRGAKTLYGGGIRPLNGFYLGLYGGSELPGVLESDLRLGAIFERNGYEQCAKVVVLQRDLIRFRAPVTREQRTLRRETEIVSDPSPSTHSWWEACQMGGIERVDFQLTKRRETIPIARVSFWDIEPLASCWGIRTAGMFEMEVHADHRRRRVASHLLSESFKELQKRGVSIVEVQVMEENEAGRALYQSLNFSPVDAGHVYRKPG